jgi:hypothetical protein
MAGEGKVGQCTHRPKEPRLGIGDGLRGAASTKKIDLGSEMPFETKQLRDCVGLANATTTFPSLWSGQG